MRDVAAWARPWRRRVGVVGIATGLVAMVLVATLTGTREPAAALQLLRGDVWLANRATGSVSHVQGYARRSDGAVAVTSPKDPFITVQRPDGAYILDTRTGVLTRVSGSTLGVAASRRIPGQPSGLQVSTGGAVTWTIDTSSGVVQEVDPSTLASTRPQIPLGGAVGSVVTDGSGTLWAALPDQGAVDQVDPATGSIIRHPVGQIGDQVQLEVTPVGTSAVDPQAGTVTSVSDPNSPVGHIPQTAVGSPPPVVASSATSPFIAVISGPVVSNVDTAIGTVASITDPSYQAVTQAVIANDQLYLLDPGSHRLDVLGLQSLRPLGSLQVPPGSDQLLTHDNLVFANDDGSPAAAVVDGAGNVTPITKYQPAAAPGPGTGSSGPAPAASGPPVPTLVGSAYGGVPAPTSAPAPAPTPLPAVAAPPILPAAPGAPTISAVTPGPGTLAVTWQPGAGVAATGYVVLTGPANGGTAMSTTAPAGATRTTIGNLSRGVTYCAQVQALGPNASQNSPLSTRVCAATTPQAPGVPTSPTFLPLNQGVDVTFGPAPNATTYTISLNGKVAQSHVAAGTYRLPFPVQHTPPGGSAPGTVMVSADANAGGPGGTVNFPVWAYDALPVIECAGPGGEIYGTAAVAGCGANRVTVAHPSYRVSNGLPSAPTDQIDCIYSAPASNARISGIYIDIPAGPGRSTCAPPPAGYGPGTRNANSWTQPGGTHTARVQEWQGTEPDGSVVHPLTGPGETPDQVAGTTLTKLSPLYAVYQDLP